MVNVRQSLQTPQPQPLDDVEMEGNHSERDIPSAGSDRSQTPTVGPSNPRLVSAVKNLVVFPSVQT